MRILALADEETKALWDFYDESLVNDVDIIISCGDLPADYLEFLVTITKKPVFYVPGNHDKKYEDDPPYGCDNLDGTITVYNGIRFLGLGGSYRYKPGPYQYSERQMKRRIRKLESLIQLYDGFDVLVAHSPLFEHGDGDDLCHRGFQAFNDLVKKYKPSYVLHGHQHLNYSFHSNRELTYEDTTLINAFRYYKFDFVPNEYRYTLPKSTPITTLSKSITKSKNMFSKKFMNQYQSYVDALKSENKKDTPQ